MATDVSIGLLDEAGARKLTERIRATLDTTARGLDRLAAYVSEAYSRRADLALGYQSWAEYASAEFGEETKDLAAPIRRQLVGYLSADGMSTRAIAPAVGVSHKTIVKDTQSIRDEVVPEVPPAPVSSGSTIVSPRGTVIAQTRHLTLDDDEDDEPTPEPEPEPRVVVGLDHKTYTIPQQKETKPRRRPIADLMREAGAELARSVERIERLSQDDRYAANTDLIQPYIRNAIQLLNQITKETLS